MKTKQLTVTASLACVLAFTFLARAQPGSLDITFNPGSGASAAVTCMALQTNGQIVIGGAFTTFNGANQKYVTRLNTDGSIDGTFGVVEAGNNVQALALQADGKILIGGAFAGVNGLQFPQHVARLRYDGSVDTSFNPGITDTNNPSIQRGYVFAVAVQNDGKVLIGGNFFYRNSTIINNAARFSTNGTLDATFNAGGGGAPFNVYAMGLQSNGQLIMGLQYGNNLERLNTDGSVDSNFLATVTGGTVYSIAVLTNDMLMIGGDFTSINGYSRQGIARLNADGSVDTTFNPGTGANNTVRCVAIQADGKVLVAGYFSSINGIKRNGIARLQANGTVDGGFNPGCGVNTPNCFPILCMVPQSDGKTLFGGQFTQFNGTNINYIARLNGDTSSTTNLQFMSPQLYFGMNLSGVVSNSYRIEYTSKFNTPSLWTPLFNVMLQTNPQFIFDPNPAEGQRFYRAVQVSP